MSDGTLLGPMKGAPLRCTLDGARYSRPGLLVAGEAAGSTYSFTGEGIGKALETGIHAAEAIIDAGGRAMPGADPDADVRAAYEATAARAEAALRPLPTGQRRQSPAVDRRPADLARPQQPAHPAAHERRAE